MVRTPSVLLPAPRGFVRGRTRGSRDVARLYEAEGLFGTPARVRLVYESALVVHEAAQVPPRAGQALAKVVGSNLQHLSGDSVAYLEDCTEDEG